MTKKAGIAIMIAGAVLILAALSLFAYNLGEDAEAGMVAENRLHELYDVIEQRQEIKETVILPMEPDEITEMTEPIDPEMTVVEIDGYGYIGYLFIPVLELELPVMSEWDYTRLKTAPCRQLGSTKTDDLVIAGHNYTRHFGTLKNLAYGDVMTFTDMEGTVNAYMIKTVNEIAPTDTDTVFNGEYDLVLYTCTYGGKTRVMVGCERITREQLEAIITGK